MSEFTDAITRLRDAQKSSRGAPAYSRFVNRPLGRPLAAGAFVAGMTPTQVTLLSGAATLLGIISIAAFNPTWWSSLIVTAFLVLGYALDSADGQLARLTGRGSLAGEWLDHFFDSIKAALVHIAVLLCWYRFYDLPDTWLLVPIGFGAVSSVFFFGVVGADILRRIHRLTAQAAGAPPAPVVAAPTSALYSLMVVPADYGLLCISFLLLWLQPVFLVVYTALAVINAMLLLASGLRWYRSISKLERS